MLVPPIVLEPDQNPPGDALLVNQDPVSVKVTVSGNVQTIKDKRNFCRRKPSGPGCRHGRGRRHAIR